MPRSIARLALLLGLITAVGPFAIDIYLPALPTLGTSLGGLAGGGANEPDRVFHDRRCVPAVLWADQ